MVVFATASGFRVAASAPRTKTLNVGESGWLDAVPIGAILFAGTLFGFFRRWFVSKTAKRGYPLLAEQLGLDLKESRAGSQLLEGVVRGVRVLVDPEENCRIVLDAPGMPPLDLRNYRHWKRTPPGMEAFSFGDRALDMGFPNRFAASGLSDALLENEEMLATLNVLRHFSDHVEHAAITNERIEVVFKKKHPASIPPQAIRNVVPALLTFSDHARRLTTREDAD